MSLGARIGRAIFWGQAGRVAEAAAFFLFYLFLARALGPASYGIFALGMSLAGACVFLTLLGLGPETLGRFLPEIVSGGRRHRARRLLAMLLAVRCAAILGVAAGVLIFRRPLAERLHFSLVSGSLALVMFLFAARSVFDLLTYFSSGLLDLKRVAIAKLAASIAAPCLFLAFWVRHVSGVNVAWLATSGGLLAGILVLAAPFLSADSARGDGALPLGRLLKFGMFAWATNFFLYVLGDNMDVLLLGWLVPSRASIGCYAVGARIVFSLTAVLLGWVALVSVASLSEAWQRGGMARLAAVAEAQWKLGVLCLVAPLLFVARYAREIITIFYSPVYAPSAPIVEILCGLMALGVVCGFSIQGGILYTLDHERIACAGVGLASLFNLVSEIFLVRRFGIAGAAWATGLSFVLVAIFCTAAGARYVPFHFPAQFIGRVIAAAGLGVAATFWLHPASILTLGAGCALYGAVFSASLAAMKPLSSMDSASLQRVNGFLGVWAQRLFANAGATVKEG